MGKISKWERLGIVLHRMSYLKVVFYLLGFYYMFLQYFGDRKHFLHHVCSMLFMFGLAMLLEALRDNELAARRKYWKKKANIERYQRVVTWAIAIFSLVVIQGLVCLYAIGEKFAGEAILTFGVGGLALFRLEYDCLTLALRERQGEDPMPMETVPESEPQIAGQPSPAVVSAGRANTAQEEGKG